MVGELIGRLMVIGRGGDGRGEGGVGIDGNRWEGWGPGASGSEEIRLGRAGS